MATVILQNQRTLYLESILETFLGASPKSLYLGLGRVASWPDDNSPPIPVNSVEERDDFFTDIIAAQVVPSSNIAIAVRRIDWTSGQEYDLFDDTSDASFTTNFYVKNSENRVYKVETKVPSSTAASEPLGTNSGSPIDTGDGYTWTYLYTIDVALETLMTTNWMPVAYDSTVTAEQTADGDVNAHISLGANHFIVISEVSDPLISDSITYRQIALLSNITDNSDVLITGSAVLAANIKNSGYMLHLENRSPITRATGQTETFQTIFKIF